MMLPARLHVRRTLLLVLGAGLLLLGCQAQPTTPAGPARLSVLEWAYYEVPEMWVEFGEQHPDVELIFNFGASDEDIFAKYLAGSGEDLVHFYTPFLQFYVDEGLIQPIDASRMTNWDKVPQGFRESCTIDGVVYCVPWDWGFSSILYRTDRVPEGVDSWAALFDERYAGHISMWDSGPAAVTVATYLLGYDERDLMDEQLEEVKQMWIDQRDLNLFYWTDEPELEAAISTGDVWVAYAWNGAYYRLLSSGVPVAYASPRQGRNSWIGQYGISAKSANYDLALAFLDGKLGEQTATNLLVDYAYGHVVPEYFGVVTDEFLIAALSLDDPTILERTNFTLPITGEDRDRFVQMWAEVKAAP
jgi:spermidine/putrescine transport system substrate-binding protein